MIGNLMMILLLLNGEYLLHTIPTIDEAIQPISLGGSTSVDELDRQIRIIEDNPQMAGIQLDAAMETVEIQAILPSEPFENQQVYPTDIVVSQAETTTEIIEIQPEIETETVETPIDVVTVEMQTDATTEAGAIQQPDVVTETVEFPRETTIGNTDPNHSEKRLFLELAIFVDNYQWQVMLMRANYNREEAIRHTRTLISAIVGHAQGVYRLPNMRPHLELKIVHHEIWEVQPASMDYTATYRNGGEIYRLWQMAEAFAKSPEQLNGNWDAAILLSNGSDNEHSGVTNVIGGACSPLSRAAVVLNLDMFGFPHELYHLLGMFHDKDDNKSTWAPTKLQFSWSARKVLHYHQFLKKNERCLTTANHQSKEHSLAVSADPGSDFAELECSLANIDFVKFDTAQIGCGFKWCSGGYRLYYTHYMTHCGDQKYCHAVLREGAEYPDIDCGKLGEYSVTERYSFAYGICLNENYHLPDGASAQPTLDDCAKLCDENEQCKAIGYIAGDCFLYSYHCFDELIQPENKANEFYVKEFDFYM